MQKKTIFIPFIGLIFLWGCTEDITEEQPEEDTTTQEDTNGEDIDQEDLETVEFSEEYDLPDDTSATFEGYIELDDNIIRNIEIEPQTPAQETFAEYAEENLIDEELQQIDTVSEASLTTEAFNEFVSNHQ